MKQNNYFVVSVNQGTKEAPKRWAWVETVSTSLNLLYAFDHIKGLDCIHYAETKKHGEEIAKAWNETYKHNGEALY